MILTSDTPCESELLGWPEQWDVAFPSGERTRSFVVQRGLNNSIGIVVHHYAESEARFVLRGDIQTAADLITCLEAGEEIARRFKCKTFTTQEKIQSIWLNSALIFLTQGFRSVDESWVFNGPFASFSIRIQRLMAMMERKNVIPQDARLSSLTEGQEHVRTLLDQTLMMDSFEFDNRLKRDSSKSISLKYSQIAWLGLSIVGVILVAPTTTKGVFDVPIRYVLPEYRQSWVNALLIHGCVDHGKEIGAQVIQFEANSKSHHETLFLAKKTGCQRVAAYNRYEKLLD